MRIGVIYLGRRGAGGPISFEIAQNLATSADVFAVVSSYSESLKAWKDSGLELIQIPTYKGIIGAIWTWMNPFIILKLVREIRKRSPDIILFPMSHAWNLLLQLYLSDIPSIVFQHDPEPHPDLFSQLFAILDYFSLRKADRCIVFSKKLIHVLAIRGVLLNKIDAIPLGILSYYNRYAKLPDKAKDVQLTTLLFFGRITAYKGLDVLLGAYKNLKKIYPDLKLVIVGSGDLRPYRGYFQDIADIQIENRWIDESEVPKYFSRKSILVLPYTSASQSGVITVAASFGLPVIATRVGGIPEQISDGVTGFLVPPGDISALSQIIEQLLNNPSLARQVGENLKSEYEQTYKWGEIVKKIFESCEKVLSESRNKYPS